MQSLTMISAYLLMASHLSQAAVPSPRSTTLNSRAVDTMEGKSVVDNLASIDITNGVPQGPIEWFEHNGTFSEDLTTENTTALSPRRWIGYCIANTAQFGACVSVAGILSQIGTGIGSNFINKAKKHDCKPETHTLDHVTWRAEARGKNCDTTAQLRTISQAMENYLRDVGDNVCGTHCIKLTHGGTWAGYVTLAPAGTKLDGYYCGPAYSFGRCD